MSLIPADIQTQVRKVFQAMDGPVKLVVFTQGEGGAIKCSMCKETRQLIEDMASLSDKIEIEMYDLVKDTGAAARYNIEKIPAVEVVSGGNQSKDYGIRM